MSVLKFDVYRKNEEVTGSVHVKSVEIDTEVESASDQQRVVGAVLELHKNKDVLVAPGNEESAWVLMKPKRGGPKKVVAPEVVKFVHEQYVNHAVPYSRIPVRVFAEFDVEVSENVVKSILNQKRDTDVPGIDDLRELAAVSRTNRKHTDEDKAEWVRMHVEDDVSGSEIADRLGINSTTVNAHLNKKGVQRNGRGRKKIEVAEQEGE